MAINYQKAQFIASYGTIDQLPKPNAPEIALAGRSNVGKSSLLNGLVGRKALAKVSSQPGKTANINFFQVDRIHLVDLPGYGFARVNQTERQRWADLISGYFESDRPLKLVCVLVDIRHEAQKLDIQMLSYIAELQLPHVIVLTKADKLTRSKQQRQASVLARSFGLEPEDMVITSSATHQGIDELKQRIELACL
ncbi:ribosome biogenesis GTP-binding protein YihA/YsxC [Olsenella sp. Marseille-QA0557]|uniref:ribosome biogenesis GTP-binding protein YihA/YsxC n=1 Tax=Olsenella sp. Marseille-QA0557 TaxID=3378782 RepID=UPI003D0C9B62